MKKTRSKKFTFSYFKKLRNLDDINAYISTRLPLLGTGSSRKVYGYSAGKVLKIAINESGLLQNAAELETFTNPKTKKVVAKIYSYGQSSDSSEKINWLLSEGVKPIATKQSFVNFSGGMDWELYKELVSKHGSCLIHPEKIDNSSEGVEKDLEKEFEHRVKYFKEAGTEEDVEWYQKQKENLQIILQTDLYSGVIECMKNSNLMPGDLLEIDHYGRTVDGALVLLDYGFTKNIADELYASRSIATSDEIIEQSNTFESSSFFKESIFLPPTKDLHIKSKKE